MSAILWLLSTPAVAAVVALDAHEVASFQQFDLKASQAAQIHSDSPLDAFSLARLATERGQVVLDHQRPLMLGFKEPVSGLALEFSDLRNQAVLSLTLLRGEHEVGRQVYAHQAIHGSRVSLFKDGRITVASLQPFDRIELRRIDSAYVAPPLEIESLSLPRSSDALIKSLDAIGSIDPLVCILPLAFAYNAAFGYALVPAPGADVASAIAYFANLALKFCKPHLVAPPDIFREVPRGVCEVEFKQPHMAFTYQNALGVPIASQSGWGQLGTPQVFHHNTAVDVLLLRNGKRPPAAPFTDLSYLLSSGSFDATDKIWERCRADGSVDLSQLSGSGPEYDCPYTKDRFLKFPVGESTVSWRANPRLSPVDLIGNFIPGLPPGSKHEPWASLLVNLARETVLIGLDSQINGWRLPHATFDYQKITVVDDVPPIIAPLPGSNGNATAVLVNNRLHVTIQAAEFGGVSRHRYEQTLRSFFHVSDACQRPTTLDATFPDPSLRAFWPVSTDSQDNSFEVTWTARDPGPNSDGLQNETVTTMRIDVVDLQPPTLIPPPDIVEIDSVQVTDLGQPAVFDLVDLAPQVSHDATLPLGLGLHEVTWTATDFSGNSSTAVQIVNIKSSNLPPLALPQTGAARQQAISFEPTPIRLRGTDPDGDPLRFKIEDRPENGFFVAPLHPYFIEDYRIERSLSDSELLTTCTLAYGNTQSFHLDFPSEPEFITATDDGRTYVVDKGYIRCRANPNTVEREGRIAVFGNDGSLLNATGFNSTTDQLRDLVLDPRRERLFLTSFRGTGNTLLRVYDLDIQQLVVYDLQDLRNRSDGACSALPNSGGSCNFLRAETGVVDDNDMIYVMNGFGAIVVLDGTLPPDFECGSQCGYRPRFVSVLNQDVANESGTGRALELDDEGRLYSARKGRIYRYTPSFMAEDGLAYPGTLDGWLGRCDIDLAPGDQAVCDVTNQRTLGFSCTDAICPVDTSNNERACPGGILAFSASSGCQPGQFFGTPPGLDLAPDGTIYVADAGNERIQRFSTDGFFAGQATSTGSGSGFVIGDFGRPQNVSANSSRFYILDTNTNLLHISLLTPFVEIGDDYADLIYQSNNQFACQNSADCIDRFSFRVSDGVRDPDTGQPGVSPPAEVEVEVSRNFRPPFATSGISVVVLEDTPTPVPLDGSDPDPLDTLSFEIIDPPSKGTVQIVGQNATFVPHANAWGADSFSFRVSDGVFTSEAEIVTVEIIEINDAPIISLPDEAIEGGTGFRMQLDLAFRDPDPDESHSLIIDWGDGTVEPGGGFDAQGNTTGPILAHAGTDSGRITGSHIYTNPGMKSIEVCVTDRMQPGPGDTQIPTPGLSLTSCEIIVASIVDAIDLALSATTSTDVALPGQFVSFQFRVENRQPQAGPGVTATGVELGIRLAQGFDPASVSTPAGCQRTDLVLFCEVDELAPGQFRELNLTTQVAASTLTGALLRTEAEVFLDQTTIHSDLSLRLHTPVARPADFQVGAVGDALRDRPDANPGDGLCASVDGVCTLRAAIEEAVASGTPKVIALSNGLYLLDDRIDLAGDIMLLGNGPEQTRIHGAELVVGGSANLRLEDLSISGGGVHAYSSNSLTTRRVRFTGNSITDGFGGAILALHTGLDIRDTTFDNNTSNVDGGTLACNSCSGVVENVTVTGGSGGGLLFIGSGQVALKHLTIVDTGGGAGYSLPSGASLHVYGDMLVSLANSVLADNHRLEDHTFREAVNCAVEDTATLISLGNNAFGDLTGCNVNPLASDMIIDNGRLEPLDSGARGLAVRRPLPDSPLVDAFDDASCLASDALGAPRPMDGNDDGIAACDVGAVERRPDAVFRSGFEG